jgi:hypothetical protein
MKVTVNRDYLAPHCSRYMDITFSIDIYEFQTWKLQRYGNAEAFRLNSIDQVGEALHLLREFYLSRRRSVNIVEAIVEVCNTSKLLPPGEPNG